MRSLNLFLHTAVTSTVLISLPLLEAQPQPEPAYRLGLLPHNLRIDARKVSINYPDDWSLTHPTANTWVILNVRADQQETAEPTVRIQVGYLKRGDHSDALSQLEDVANESSAPATFLTIGGWPALQRVQIVKRPQPSQARRHPDLMMVQVTTAVAAGDLLIRLDGRLPSDASQQLKDLALDIGKSLGFSVQPNAAKVEQELQRLKSLPRRPEPPPGGAALADGLAGLAAIEGRAIAPRDNPSAAGASLIFPSTQVDNITNGEFDVAVSNNGSNIVIAKGNGFQTSNNGGQSFTSSSFFNVKDGDGSVAFGQSGNFYGAALACFGSSCASVCPANSTCIETASSTTNGQSFGALVNAVVCPNSGGGACSVDQEHIGADRINAAAGSKDNVYMVFRQCLGGCGSESDVVCSSDSGATWTPRLSIEANADFPRLTVGKDGFLYVVYEVSGNIRVNKYNSCSNPMTNVAGFPKTVSAFNKVAGCETGPGGFPGLDRCNDGNTLSSPMVAVDDTNANHVYVAWANNTASNNENIQVADSTDGGATWRAPVTVNGGGSARRILPWVCATDGNAYVTWYDRRNATVANNDLTDYFAASAGLSAGNLVPNNDEFKISTASDAQCTFWPSAPRSLWDSENCSVQPQNAGTCSVTKTQRCDFQGGDGLQCPGGETCQTGGGSPKYGDYNGNACTLGRLDTVFATGAGQTAVKDFFQSFVVGPTTTATVYSGATTGDFDDSVTLSGTLTLSGTTAGISGQTLKFTVGAQSCTGTTSASGFASCPLTLNQVPGGAYTVQASFAGSGNYQASSSTAVTFTITKEEDTLTYTGPTVIANGVSTTFSAVLKEDGVTPISGRSVLFTLGTGITAQTCSGTTDGTGTAKCPILVNQPLGAGTVTANFAGDAFYLPSSDSASTILFSFLAKGAFTLGNLTDSGSVEFWGDDWAIMNRLTGGAAPDAFKGFAANTAEPPACGGTWTTRPGNSSDPPDGPLPSYMGVVVSSAIDKSGPTILGNVLQILVVTTNPGYASNPGHHGTGTVVATFCK